MLAVVGIGASGIIQAHIRQQRYISYQREARHAYNRGLRGIKPGKVTTEEVEWESFPCFYLCMNCGYLGDKNQSESTCPGCDLQKWTDLRNIGIAEQIREMENRERQLVPAKVKKQSGLISSLLSILVGGVVAWLSYSAGLSIEYMIVYGAAAFIVTFVLSWFVSNYLFTMSYFSKRRRFPSRWRLPVPLPAKDAIPSQTLKGPVKAQGELLKSPISGRDCVGYEVSVLFDVAGDKRPPMWVLEEERTVPFQIGGEVIEADRVTLELPPTMVGDEENLEQEKKIGLFLRQRGLFVSEGFYKVFEAIIEPGKQYQVSLFENPPGAAATIFRG